MVALIVMELWKKFLLVKGINMEIVLVICMIIILMGGIYLIKVHKKSKDLLKRNEDLYSKCTEQEKEYCAKNEVVGTLLKDLRFASENNTKLSADYTAMVNKYYSDIKDIKLLHEDTLSKLQNTYDRELSARKSSEVRVGKTVENFAPLLSGWPYDPYNFRFIGGVVDGLQIEKDKIIFVEIKTGKARLTNSQQNIQRLIKEGKVEFAILRINDQGVCIA